MDWRDQDYDDYHGEVPNAPLEKLQAKLDKNRDQIEYLIEMAYGDEPFDVDAFKIGLCDICKVFEIKERPHVQPLKIREV